VNIIDFVTCHIYRVPARFLTQLNVFSCEIADVHGDVIVVGKEEEKDGQPRVRRYGAKEAPSFVPIRNHLRHLLR